MKTHYKGILMVFCAVLSLGLALAQPAGAVVPATALPLGEFPQGSADGVNYSGKITGSLFGGPDGYDHACRWDSATADPTILVRATEHLDGFVHTYGEYINSSGEVAGTAWDGLWEDSRVFFWTEATGMVDIGLPVTGDYNSVFVKGLNDDGQILAEVTAYDADWNLINYITFIWSDGDISELTYTDPDTYTTYDILIWSGAINNTGQVAGLVDMGSGNRPAVLWEAGTATILTPGIYAGAVYINSDGQVAGGTSTSGQNPWIYTPGEPLRHIDVTGQYDDMADGYINVRGLNDAGQVLIYQSSPVIRAMVWVDDGLGGDFFTEIPLSAVVGPEHYNRSVYQLNEQGQALAVVQDAVSLRAFLWDPDPATLTGMAELAPLTGTTRVWVDEMNDTGLAAGVSYTNSSDYFQPCTWQTTGAAVNYPPVLDVADAPASGFAGTEITFTATATDPDGDTLTFSIDPDDDPEAPEGATINPDTGDFSWTPAAAGQYTFTVRVADSKNFYDTANVTIDVTRPSSLTLTVQSVERRGKSVVVWVLIENPTAADVADVAVSAASLGGVDTNTRLPVTTKKIRAGSSTKCQFKFAGDAVPAGEASFSAEGTSSLGGFDTTETVTVP